MYWRDSVNLHLPTLISLASMAFSFSYSTSLESLETVAWMTCCSKAMFQAGHLQIRTHFDQGIKLKIIVLVLLHSTGNIIVIVTYF